MAFGITPYIRGSDSLHKRSGMKNKEVSGRLREYFKKQDVEDVVYLTASLTVDLLRFLHFDQLGEAERKSLIERTTMMSTQVSAFMRSKPGTTKPMHIHKMDSRETNDD